MSPRSHNNPVDEIRLRYGTVSVGTLREFYGSFAPHCASSKNLGDVLADLDGASLTQLLLDLKRGRLEKICQPRL
jgi:hypothetical protein